jgi:uracil-DNA glycosylase family 4
MTIAELQREMRACRRCLDAGHALTPGAIFSGGAPARVMLIGQAPGATEVEAQRPFNAGSGTRLFQWLAQAGWAEADFRARYYMTAVTKCYPGKSANGRGDRAPSPAEQQLCRPFLEREIALVNPRLIIPVGGLALKLFFPARLKLAEAIGTAVSLPSAALRDPDGADLQGGEWLRPATAEAFAARVAARAAVRGDDGCFVVPLPHPSGASLWPNRPAHRALIDRALALLGAWREGEERRVTRRSRRGTRRG